MRVCPLGAVTSSLVLACFDSGRRSILSRAAATTTASQLPNLDYKTTTIMERTPSPPRRLHTPPAPLYGDSYEPFSPRRSSRVAAQHGLHYEQTTPRPRVRRDVTPTASAKRSLARPSNFTLSPPSSPSSPHHLRSPRSTRRAPHDFNTLDSDSDHVAPTPARRLLSTMASVSRENPPRPISQAVC